MPKAVTFKIGRSNGVIVAINLRDFQEYGCPNCRRKAPVVLERYTGKSRVHLGALALCCRSCHDIFIALAPGMYSSPFIFVGKKGEPAMELMTIDDSVAEEDLRVVPALQRHPWHGLPPRKTSVRMALA